jgi:8-oxo-dGTP diphosphatase
MDNTNMPNIIRVTAAVMVNDGMMLIAKRKPTARLPNLLERPGGKVEPKETPDECLKRELKEEFDIDVTVNPLFIYTSKNCRLQGCLVL